MSPPRFTSRQSIQDFIEATKRATGIVMIVRIELGFRSLNGATKWLANHWDVYFTPEQQEQILVEFTTRRLSK